MLLVLLLAACSDPGPGAGAAGQEGARPSAEGEAGTELRFQPEHPEGAEAPVHLLRHAVFVEHAEPPHSLFVSAEPRELFTYCQNSAMQHISVLIEAPSLELGRAHDNGGMGLEGVALNARAEGERVSYGFQQGRFELTAVTEEEVRGRIEVNLESRGRPGLETGRLRGEFIARRLSCP